MKPTGGGEPAGGRRPHVAGRVYDLVAAIPAGRVMTYGGVAAELGLPRGAREVGWALGRCHEEPDVVPCHRVILSTGRPSAGFAGGCPDLQRRLLEAEGVVFGGDGRLDLGAYLWWPPDAAASSREDGDGARR